MDDKYEVEKLYNIDLSQYEILYFDIKSDWSWAAILIIFCDKEKYYIQDDFDEWRPYQVTEEIVWQQIKDFENEPA